MTYNEAIDLCNVHITNNISNNITASELADMCGYSLYHFCHLFKVWYDMPVGEYIRVQRLKHGAALILQGKSITYAAMEAGFETPAGFTKAFRKKYGISPSEYRRTNLKGARIMTPVIKNLNEIKAFGYSIIPGTGDINVLESGAYWSDVDFKDLPKFPENCENIGEVALWYHPEEVSGDLIYFFGFISETDIVPEGFYPMTIPASQYAVFKADNADTFGGLKANIKNLWKYIFKEWFDSSVYKFGTKGMCFELYKGEAAYVCVPVIEK